MFIGEAPGADEDKQGEPFVGRAGQLLTRIIQTMGLAREDVYIANILKCRPDMPPGSYGNRPPTAIEMQTCRPYFVEQIDIIQPKVLVALWVRPRWKACSACAARCANCAVAGILTTARLDDHVSSGIFVAQSGAFGKTQNLGRHAPRHRAPRETDQRKTTQLFLVQPHGKSAATAQSAETSIQFAGARPK